VHPPNARHVPSGDGAMPSRGEGGWDLLLSGTLWSGMRGSFWKTRIVRIRNYAVGRLGGAADDDFEGGQLADATCLIDAVLVVRNSSWLRIRRLDPRHGEQVRRGGRWREGAAAVLRGIGAWVFMVAPFRLGLVEARE